MTIYVRKVAFPLLRLSGELDLASCHELRVQLDELSESRNRLIVDLQAVTFIGGSP